MNHAIPNADRPLRVEGFAGTPEQIEQQWYEEVYLGRGDVMPQLTWRAVLIGAGIGGLLSLTNLYVNLKAGFVFGVTITACIVSFGLWSVLQKAGLAKSQLSILENNCMQSTASAAGYSTGTTLCSAIAAYFMINGHPVPLGQTLVWVFFLSVLGITMAIPMKRQMINVEQLRFPTGIASAEMLHALYSKGQRSRQSARALTIAAIAAASSEFWSDGLALVSTRLAPFGLGAFIDRLNAAVLGPAWTTRTVAFVWDPVFIAGGVLMGLRAAASIFAGGVLCWCVFVPYLQGEGVITGHAYRDLIQWTVWGGVSCMVSSGLFTLALQWRSITRAFSSLGAMFRNQSSALTAVDALETPMSWFLAGLLVSLVAIAYLAKVSFGMPVWQSALAVALSFLLVFVGCRVTGETDTNPSGPMGKVTQLLFGALSPGNINVNLMSANITAGSVSASADLLTDLKSGYLLGANPRKQFLAQFAGIFVGAVTTVLAFHVLVPDVSVLGSTKFPAPAAQSWRAVALVLSRGLGALEPVKLWSIGIGVVVGVTLTLLPRWLPKHAKWMPSAAGLGLAWTFPWYYGMLFFIGGLIGWSMERRHPKTAEIYNFPVAAGVIAGGSLMGVALVFWENGPAVLRQLLGH
ncbi:MAG: OPT family oligopeptide transporter [Steroidobacterales bacterium]